MNSVTPAPRQVSRITCHVHIQISHRVAEFLVALGSNNVLVESGRTVRQLRKQRPFRFPGTIDRLDDAPAEVFHITVPVETERMVVEGIIKTAELDAPGRGSIFSQRLEEYGDSVATEAVQPSDNVGRYVLMHDLTLITCILSMPGSGQHIARIALELGSCVPVVTLGVGTGIRDHLGLLRITVPAEKEIVHLLAPEHDADQIIRLLIEEGRLDRPGRGFIYRTPVDGGMLDTRLRVGRQEHAASIEQIIAAIDELRHGTAWRKRFAAIDRSGGDPTSRLRLDNREITLICSEGRAGMLVEAAIDTGAGGATTSRLHRLNIGDTDGGTAACERSIISVPANYTNGIIEALLNAGALSEDNAARIQVAEAPAAFSHR